MLLQMRHMHAEPGNMGDKLMQALSRSMSPVTEYHIYGSAPVYTESHITTAGMRITEPAAYQQLLPEAHCRQ